MPKVSEIAKIWGVIAKQDQRIADLEAQSGKPDPPPTAPEPDEEPQAERSRA